MRYVSTALLLHALLMPAAAAGPPARARYLMGTICSIEAAGTEVTTEEAFDRAFAEADRIERMLSTWTEQSELAAVNRGEAAAGPELRALLDRAMELSRLTGSAFDPRIGALVDAWQTRGDGAVPAPDVIAAALHDRESRTPRWEEGGFGKGYALDRMLALIPDSAVTLDFGGQLLVRGSREVVVADPEDRRRGVLSFMLTDGSVSTSSGSEKTFESSGRKFSHILDPRSGEAVPPRGSASALADDALSADILSTALYVMGVDDGLRWADAHGIAAIFITADKQIRLSTAARERARGPRVLDRTFQLKD